MPKVYYAADVVIARCKNNLETQADIASAFATMLAELDQTPADKVTEVIDAIRARWPSKTAVNRIKRMAWRTFETRQRAARGRIPPTSNNLETTDENKGS